MLPNAGRSKHIVHNQLMLAVLQFPLVWALGKVEGGESASSPGGLLEARTALERLSSPWHPLQWQSLGKA